MGEGQQNQHPQSFKTRQQAEIFLEQHWDRFLDVSYADQFEPASAKSDKFLLRLWKEQSVIVDMLQGFGMERARDYFSGFRGWIVLENQRHFRAGLKRKHPKKAGRKTGISVSGKAAPNLVSIVMQVSGLINSGVQVKTAIDQTAARYGMASEAIRKTYERGRDKIVHM